MNKDDIYYSNKNPFLSKCSSYTVTVTETEVKYTHYYITYKPLYTKTSNWHCDSDGNGSQIYPFHIYYLIYKPLYTETFNWHCDSDGNGSQIYPFHIYYLIYKPLYTETFNWHCDSDGNGSQLEPSIFLFTTLK